MQIKDVILRSTRALQPLATIVPIGTIYYVTDEAVTERSNGTIWQSISDSGTGLNQLTGDVTAGPGSGSQVATIGNKKVTYAKIQDISATARVLGRKTAGSGTTEECTLSEVLDFVTGATRGDILYRNATVWTRLPAGTAGQVLQTNGTTGDPAWATASGGAGWALVATRTVTTSPEVFTGLAAYDEVMVVLYGVTVSSSGAIRRMKVSTDNGASYLGGATDYLQFDSNGAKTDKANLDFDNGNNASAHYIWLTISGMKLAAPKMVTSGFPTTNLCQMITTTAVINALEVLPHQNALNGGTIYVFGR